MPPKKPNWAMNVVMSLAVCFAWGFLLYIGNLDTLWRILGISNQLLASIALAVGTTYILKHSRRRVYALCTAVPLVLVLTAVVWASLVSIGGWWKLAFSPATPAGNTFLLKLACVLASAMLVMTVIIALDALRRCIQLLARPREEPPSQLVQMPDHESAATK